MSSQRGEHDESFEATPTREERFLFFLTLGAALVVGATVALYFLFR